MAELAVRHLTFARAGQAVLHDISFSVAAGEALVILGPSGGGKSTLLRCINRLEEPPSGQIYLDGVDITALPVTDLRRRVGMVFQKTAAFEGTVADNICTGPRLRGETLSLARLRELMGLVALDVDLLDKSAQQLSGGQEQRMGIARALANEPAVLLLDEPTSSLDPIATGELERSLQALRRDLQIPLVWVSHTIEQARRVADRVLFLQAGRVVRVDSVAAMLDPINGDERVLAFAAGEA